MKNLIKNAGGFVAVGAVALAGRIIYLKGKADVIQELKDQGVIPQDSVDNEEDIEVEE